MAKKQTRRVKQAVALPQNEIERWFAEVRNTSEQFNDANPMFMESFLNGILYRRAIVGSGDDFEDFRRLGKYFGDFNANSLESSFNQRTIIYFLAFVSGILRWAKVDPSPKLRDMAVKCEMFIDKITLEESVLLRNNNGRCTDRELIKLIDILEQIDTKLYDDEYRLERINYILVQLKSRLIDYIHERRFDGRRIHDFFVHDTSDMSCILVELAKRDGNNVSLSKNGFENHQSGPCGQHDIESPRGFWTNFNVKDHWDSASRAAFILHDLLVNKERFHFPTKESIKDSVVPEIYTELRTRLLVFRHTIEIISLMPDNVDSELASALSHMLADQLPYLTNVTMYKKDLYHLGLALEASSTAMAYIKGLLDVRAYPLLNSKARMAYHNIGDNIAECRIGKRAIKMPDGIFDFMDSLVWYRSLTTDELKEHIGEEKWDSSRKGVDRLRKKQNEFPEFSDLITPPRQGSQEPWTTEILVACDECGSPLPIKKSKFERNKIFKCKCGNEVKGIIDPYAPGDIQNNMEEI